MKTIKELCKKYGLGQTELARRFDIPLRTIQNWHAEVRTPPDYVVRMMDELLDRDAELLTKIMERAAEDRDKKVEQ